MSTEKRIKHLSGRLLSLPVQLILRFTAVAILTTAAAGFPVLWLTSARLEQQAWDQVENGSHSARALYRAYHSQLVSLSRLTAQRPSLSNLLLKGSKDELEAYLYVLQTGAEVDFILICDAERQPIAASTKIIGANWCQLEIPENGYTAVDGQVWILAGMPIRENDPHFPSVLLGKRTNKAFLARLHEETGLEHLITIEGQIAASSLEMTSARLNLQEMPARGKAPLSLPNRAVMNLDRRPFYATRLALDRSRIEAVVALDVSSVFTARQQLIRWILASLLGAAAFGSAIGILQARRISRPLVRLADSAAQFSRGDLSASVQTPSRIPEIAQVAEALEKARLGILSTLTDLRNEKNRINHLLEALVEGIVTCNAQNEITFFSRGAEQMTGLDRQQVIGRQCSEIFRLLNSDAPLHSLRRVTDTPQNCLVAFPDDTQHTLSITFAELEAQPGVAPEWIMVFRDVTAEETLHRLLGQFIANIAHEFRTPLSALAASIELLLDQSPVANPAETEELLMSLHLGILGLQTLVDNLLESASIEAGLFRVSLRPCEVEKIIQEAAATLQPMFRKYGQRLVLDLPTDLPLVQADPRRTIQVLINLLSNANRYGPPNAEITVSAAVLENQVKIQVADQGPGIPADQRKEIFRRFVYPPQSQRHQKIGAGLGLSVVKAVVEASGGQVGVDDNPSGGSIFWFTLPKAVDI